MGLSSLLMLMSTESAWAQSLDSEEPALQEEDTFASDTPISDAPTPDISSPDDSMMAASEPAAETDVVEEAPAAESTEGGVFNYELLGSGVYLFDGYTTSQPYSGALGYPYTQSHGFLGNFFGGNFSYGEGNWGATVDLRWGTGAPLLTPLAPLKQGYVTWKPKETITLDLGFMDTIFGAEVADEWANVNFSRGALYFLRQPFNHMGLRVGVEVNDKMALNFLVTNGPTGAIGLGGQPVDSDQVPSVAAQVSYAPDDTTGVALGFMSGPNGSSPNENFGHFVDLVVTKSLDKVSLVFNADVTIDSNVVPDETVLLFGGSLAASAPVGDKYSAGGRVEFLGGSNAGPGAGADDYIMTVTGTLRHMASDNLVISVEPRVEFAGEDVYVSDDGVESVWYGLIVGASAHFGN